MTEAPTGKLSAVCANCGSPREADAVFCEVCGLDFTTGKLPAAPPPPTEPASPASAWVVVVDVDKAFFESNQSDESLVPPADQPPAEIPLRSDEILIGRTSASANIHPDVDLGSDPGVSRRHAVLHRRGESWFVTDEGSTNGTQLGGKLLPAREEREVHEGDVIHLGAWTRLTLRRAAGS